MSTVVMHNVVSVDGYIADDNDDVGPLFEWYSNGDAELVDGGSLKMSQASADYVRWAGPRAGPGGRGGDGCLPVVFGSGKRYFGPVDGQRPS